MPTYASNKPRGVESSSKKGNNRLQDLEDELITKAAAKTDEIGAVNGSTQKEGGGPTKKQRVESARQLFISQGKRQRKPSDLLNWYAAAAYRPENVTSFWQKALDAEHDRYELPDVYEEYNDNPTTSQYGLVSTSVKNYAQSRRRLSDFVAVGV